MSAPLYAVIAVSVVSLISLIGLFAISLKESTLDQVLFILISFLSRLNSRHRIFRFIT
jgi:hypothetical protein